MKKQEIIAARIAIYDYYNIDLDIFYDKIVESVKKYKKDNNTVEYTDTITFSITFDRGYYGADSELEVSALVHRMETDKELATRIKTEEEYKKAKQKSEERRKADREKRELKKVENATKQILLLKEQEYEQYLKLRDKYGNEKHSLDKSVK